MAYALHLDPLFEPYSHLQPLAYETFIFAGGEPHIKLGNKDLTGATVHVTTRVRNWQDLGLLAIAFDALQRAGATHIELTLPYFPGARQDRLMIPGEALTVKVYADFINQLSPKQVTIFDPHSEVAPALLHRVRVVSNVGFAKQVLSVLPQDCLLVSPDAGASKKIFKVAAQTTATDVIECGKRRDVRTGALSGFTVFADDLGGRACLILDDICDGGGTFLGLAKQLKQHHAGPLYLAVSHGIFSRGVEALTAAFDKVFCTDAFSTLAPQPGLQQIALATLLPST